MLKNQDIFITLFVNLFQFGKGRVVHECEIGDFCPSPDGLLVSKLYFE